MTVADDATRRFPGRPHEVAAARRFVAETLHRWDLTAVCDDALLIVSELVSNAIVHGEGDPVVALERVSGGVRVSVHDGGSGRPVPRQPTPADLSGRGLQMIDRLARRWGHDTDRSGGKTVWAEIVVPASG